MIYFRTSYQHVEPGFDFVRYLKALRQRWYWFLFSLIVVSSSIFYLQKKAPKRYDLAAKFFIQKDIETDSYGAQNRIKFLRLFAKRNNVENHIGDLKSNQMLYKVLYKNDKHLEYSSSNSPVLFKTKSQLFPTQKIFKITAVDSASCHVKSDESKVKLMNFERGYFDTKIVSQPIDTVIRYGTLVSVQNYAFEVHKSEFYKPEFQTTVKAVNLQKIAGEYNQSVRIKTLNKGASIVTLGISTSDPNTDAKILNELMTLNIQNELDRQENLVAHLTDCLEGELMFHEQRLRELEKLKTKESGDLIGINSSGVYESISKYQSPSSTIQIDQKINGAFTGNYIMNVDVNSRFLMKSLLELEQEKSRLESWVKQLKFYQEDFEKGHSVVLSGINISKNLETLLAEYNRLRALIDEAEVTKAESHPSLVSYKAQFQFLKKEIKHSLEESIFQTQLSLHHKTERGVFLENQINQIVTQSTSAARVNFLMDLEQKQIAKLNKRKAEAGLAGAFGETYFTILENANPNKKPFAPLNAEGIIVAVLIALMIPVCLVFLDGLRGSRVYGKDQIEQLTQDELIGHVSRFTHSIKRPYVFAKRKSFFDESFLLFAREFIQKTEDVVRINSSLGLSKKGIVLGVHQVFPGTDGLNLIGNLKNAGEVLCKKILFVKILPNSNQLSDIQLNLQGSQEVELSVKNYESEQELKNWFLNQKENFDLILVKTPVDIPDQMKIEWSKYFDLNVGLIKEHRTREHNISSFISGMRQVSEAPVKLIYLDGFFKPIFLPFMRQGHYDLKFKGFGYNSFLLKMKSLVLKH